MRADVDRICFADGRVELAAVAGAAGGRDVDDVIRTLEAALDAAATDAVRPGRVRLDPRLERGAAARLRAWTRDRGLRWRTAAAPPPPSLEDRCEGLFRVPRRGRGTYELVLCDLAHAATRATTAVRILTAVHDVDPGARIRLRLCLYELVTNSMDHGAFETGAPAVRVRFTLGVDVVRVEYADNAAAFDPRTGGHDGIVGERIRASRRRGLGLYLLNRLCRNLAYRRVRGWNRTTFELDFRPEREPVEGR